MDILDIDEILKDDSFFLLADNSQDDVTNILQQWRLNSSNSAQGTIFDTRTFTRPKRRSGLNLETNFVNGSSPQDSIMNSAKINYNNNNIHLKVGGLVTSMQKSFLNDTSPPSSICSSMDVSNERMNSSLITSGDFTNVSFFNTNSDDLLPDAHFSGYSLNDVIKDREFLENLSLSGDSTIIKDANIAQTDEISYLSKTNSGNSTMHNSTESMSNGVLNETYVPLNQTVVAKSNSNRLNTAEVNEIENIATKLKLDTKMYDDDLLKDTKFSLVDSLSMSHKECMDDMMNETVVISHPNANLTSTKENPILNTTFDKIVEQDVDSQTNTKNIQSQTFDKVIMNNIGNGTFDLDNGDEVNNEMNVTYERKNLTFDQIGTPKSESKCGLMRTIQSTPHRSPIVRNALKETINISPIVPVEEPYKPVESPVTSKSNDMTKSKFDRIETYLKGMSDNFVNCVDPGISDHSFESELPDNDILNKSIALVDGGDNEKEFDDMLDQLGKNTISADAIKMRQSLDNIKKRYSLATCEKAQENKQNSDVNAESCSSLQASMGKSSLLSSSGSERLLSRRSRLFDDVKVNPTCEEKKNQTLSKTENEDMDNKKCQAEQKTDCSNEKSDENDVEQDEKLSRKQDRDRDRDRFKTIRIFRHEITDLNVPCIDGEGQNGVLVDEHQAVVPTSIENDQRFSRKDYNSPTLSVTNKHPKEQHNIYQTYKVPKDTALKKPVVDVTKENEKSASDTGRQRSLSRPKHFTDHTKLEASHGDVLPKANSAGDLDTLKSMKPQQKGNFGFSSRMPRTKQISQPSLVPQTLSHEKQAQLDRSSRNSLLSKPSTVQRNVEQNGTSIFKVPHPISNLPAPNSRRTGLVRPSSGFYSYNVTRNDSDSESGRYSPSNSMSSASSKGSTQDIQQKCLNGHISDDNIINETHKQDTAVTQSAQNKPMVNKTSIPKPSGLRPPSNIRKSGLPRPASIVRR